MKKIFDIKLIIIIILYICLITMTILFFLGRKNDNKYNYYQCIKSEIDSEYNIYEEQITYDIEFESNYSLKKINSYTKYVYHVLDNYEVVKNEYLKTNDSNVSFDDDSMTITINGINDNISEGTWVVTYVDNLIENGYTCEIK